MDNKGDILSLIIKIISDYRNTYTQFFVIIKFFINFFDSYIYTAHHIPQPNFWWPLLNNVFSLTTKQLLIDIKSQIYLIYVSYSQVVVPPQSEMSKYISTN